MHDGCERGVDSCQFRRRGQCSDFGACGPARENRHIARSIGSGNGESDDTDPPKRAFRHVLRVRVGPQTLRSRPELTVRGQVFCRCGFGRTVGKTSCRKSPFDHAPQPIVRGMASLVDRTPTLKNGKKGNPTLQVGWVLGGARGGGGQCETFRGKKKDAVLKEANLFKAAIEAAGHQWPENYIPKVGWVDSDTYRRLMAVDTPAEAPDAPGPSAVPRLRPGLEGRAVRHRAADPHPVPADHRQPHPALVQERTHRRHRVIQRHRHRLLDQPAQRTAPRRRSPTKPARGRS